SVGLLRVRQGNALLVHDSHVEHQRVNRTAPLAPGGVLGDFLARVDDHRRRPVALLRVGPPGLQPLDSVADAHGVSPFSRSGRYSSRVRTTRSVTSDTCTLPHPGHARTGSGSAGGSHPTRSTVTTSRGLEQRGAVVLSSRANLLPMPITSPCAAVVR